MDLLSPTPSPAEIAKKYSIPEDFLAPERYLTEVLYLPIELHNALKDRLVVQPEKHLSHEQVIKQIRESLRENDFTFFGIDHGSAICHEKIAKMVQAQQDTPFAVAIEYPNEMQTYIDTFMKTGRFRINDDPNKYPAIYDEIQRKGNYDLPVNLQNTVFDEHSELIQVYPILLAARGTNKSVFCFDVNQEEDRSDTNEEGMEANLTQTKRDLGIPVLVVSGSEHCAKKSYTSEAGNAITSVAKRLQMHASSVQSFLWDNNESAKKWATEGTTVESVLHAKIKDATQDIGTIQGLLLDERTFPSQEELVEKIGFDCYIAA